MRYLTLLFCLMAGLTLHAQSGYESKNTWEISASFAPDIHKRPYLTGVRLETNPDDIPLSQRRFTFFDTITIVGQDRIFNRQPGFGFRAEPSSSNLWFSASITAHRRIGEGLDISAGLFYSQAGFTTGINSNVVQAGVVNTTVPIIYNLEIVEQRAYGITARGNYHVFPKARLHPYFGMGVNLYHFKRTRLNAGRAYASETVTVLPASTSQPLSENSSVSLDFIATAGLLFRLTDDWSFGLDITSRPFIGPGLVGLQVRRRL
jgi:hypothetical protein